MRRRYIQVNHHNRDLISTLNHGNMLKLAA